ncbi:unnamed protein product [Rangifer tarandus platyrhynchus]|uniref:Uncharacterized protein n=1 Tax=Rangifer tarandus platyrhynchus TaxID=3082113 RepID=A0ABN8ZFL1_RANTA|nr:unnamed protein product [Rangifer tarandus platyrhynchus]
MGTFKGRFKLSLKNTPSLPKQPVQVFPLGVPLVTWVPPSHCSEAYLSAEPRSARRGRTGPPTQPVAEDRQTSEQQSQALRIQWRHPSERYTSCELRAGSNTSELNVCKYSCFELQSLFSSWPQV